MERDGIATAMGLTAAMLHAADAEDWETVAALAGERHGVLETALAGDAWRVQDDLIAQLRDILAADRRLAEAAGAARRQTADALRELRGGQRMHSAYAAQAAVG